MEHRDVELPIETSKNPNGIFVRECVEVFASGLDKVALRREIAYLKQHVIIVKFADNIPP